MQTTKSALLLALSDYDTIMAHLRNPVGKATLSRHEAEELEAELKKATLVNSDALPGDVVRLNSTVIILDEKEAKQMQVTVVTPGKADIRQRKISIMSPIGTALIGYRKGARVRWRVPAGFKTFTIIDVVHPSPLAGDAY